MFKRSWVWIPALYTWWTFLTFSCWFVEKLYCLIEKTENKRTSGRGWPIFKKSTQRTVVHIRCAPCLSPVLPYGGKSSPISSNSCPKSSHSSFFYKIDAFPNSPKVIQYLGYFCKNDICQELRKIAQSGHTVLDLGNTNLAIIEVISTYLKPFLGKKILKGRERFPTLCSIIVSSFRDWSSIFIVTRLIHLYATDN